MLYSYLFLASAIVSNVAAVPLNINLGAYSPALVVGDGEISFGGKQDVSNLMNALEGAAVTAAANGAATTATTAKAVNGEAVAVAPTASSASAAAIIATPSPSAVLQGMGKAASPQVNDIAPRIKDATAAPALKSRDLSGFDRALNYATAALKTSPKVQLGTGAEGSGVGILQDAGSATAATTTAAKQITSELAAREVTLPKMKQTVTTMYIRGGPIPASKSL
jgi:hypothetical protein